MNNRGFTLIELFVAIAIITTLLLIAVMDFGAMQRKAQVDRFTKELYGDLQEARMRAAFTRQPQGVALEVNAAGNKSRAVFRRFLNEDDPAGVVTETKNYPFLFTANSSVTNIEFNTRGVMKGAVTRVICAQPNVGAPHDALIVDQAVTNLGKWTNRGGGCASANIAKK